MSMPFPPHPVPQPPPPDLATQETTLRDLMKRLVDNYKRGIISGAQFGVQYNDLAARLFDVQKAMQRQLVQQQYQQYAAQQQALLSQSLMSMTERLAPAKALETEDAFGEVIAWRAWLSRVLPVLTSCYREDFIWMPRQIEEAKGVGDYNQLGFHAWKDQRAAIRYSLELGPVVIVGRVKLWGTVIHHELGYRAQFAKILSLDTMITFHADAQERISMPILRHHYGVDGPEDHKKKGKRDAPKA
jgi:hypothetical protein